MPETIAVDEAIAAYLRQTDTKSAESLASTGEAGVQRLLGLWYGTAADPLPNPIPEVSSRDAVDRWSSALAIVASAAPSAFVDGIADLGMSTTLLAILGDVADPRAIPTLAQHIDDEDWLTRYNAVSSLGRQNDPAARPFIDRALADDDLVVRAAAIKAVAGWDPDRAIALYSELLDSPAITAVLRSQASAAITLLKGTFPVERAEAEPAQPTEPAEPTEPEQP
jgi:HEAT repeat protein